MSYDARNILDDFNRTMTDIRKSIPAEYEAFIGQKEVITRKGRLSAKDKWLQLLVASVSQKCPVCISRAVMHCLEAGWSKEEMLEACMVAVLVGGSSVMTYVTFVDRAIGDLSEKK